MVRSLYSGVAGMSTQQKKMDVIGNNIANVSTNGFKASRATFRDVYYQTSNAAEGPTATQGGRNAVQIGYGAKLGSTDVNHSQSVMTTTGLSLDCAIAGEGFFQVMNADGDIYYTKAGMFDIDASGHLVDINGNYVLGVAGSDVTQPADSQKIKISLPYLEPSIATDTDTLNGVGITISSTEKNENGNIAFSFVSSEALPIGEKVSAKVGTNSIAITLNANETFADLDELQKAVNDAIRAANGGLDHDAGDFTIELSSDEVFTTPLTGAQIISSDFSVQSGTVDVPDSMSKAFSVASVGDKFSATTALDYAVTVDEANGTCTITAGDYSATMTQSQMATAGSVVMQRNAYNDADGNPVDTTGDSFVLTFPSWNSLITNYGTSLTGTAEEVSTPSTDSVNLGLGAGTFTLSGGTAGGIQTVADLEGLSIASDGVIYGIHPTMGTLTLGRIDLATFDNTSGLTQVGSTYFAQTDNSGEPQVTVSGKNGSGEIAGGTLENSNVDLSQEFSDMIITQRGFQASSRVITVSDTMLEELINLKR